MFILRCILWTKLINVAVDQWPMPILLLCVLTIYCIYWWTTTWTDWGMCLPFVEGVWGFVEGGCALQWTASIRTALHKFNNTDTENKMIPKMHMNINTAGKDNIRRKTFSQMYLEHYATELVSFADVHSYLHIPIATVYVSFPRTEIQN